MLFVLIFRRSNDQNDMDYDYKDDGMPINKIRNLDWRLKYDSNVKFILNIKMFLNFVDIDFYYIFYKNQSKYLNEMSLTDTDLEEYRKKKENEKKIWNSLKEIILYSIFIWLIFIVSYSKKDINSFNYQRMLKNVFDLNDECRRDFSVMCFNDVTNTYGLFNL